jgi:hypothetical protein
MIRNRLKPYICLRDSLLNPLHICCKKQYIIIFGYSIETDIHTANFKKIEPYLYYLLAAYFLIGCCLYFIFIIWPYSVVVSTQDFESCDRGSNPRKTLYARIAQLVERSAVNREVSGSKPDVSENDLYLFSYSHKIEILFVYKKYFTLFSKLLDYYSVQTDFPTDIICDYYCV